MPPNALPHDEGNRRAALVVVAALLGLCPGCDVVLACTLSQCEGPSTTRCSWRCDGELASSGFSPSSLEDCRAGAPLDAGTACVVQHCIDDECTTLAGGDDAGTSDDESDAP